MIDFCSQKTVVKGEFISFFTKGTKKNLRSRQAELKYLNIINILRQTYRKCEANFKKEFIGSQKINDVLTKKNMSETSLTAASKKIIKSRTKKNCVCII